MLQNTIWMSAFMEIHSINLPEFKFSALDRDITESEASVIARDFLAFACPGGDCTEEDVRDSILSNVSDFDIGYRPFETLGKSDPIIVSNVESAGDSAEACAVMLLPCGFGVFVDILTSENGSSVINFEVFDGAKYPEAELEFQRAFTAHHMAIAFEGSAADPDTFIDLVNQYLEGNPVLKAALDCRSLHSIANIEAGRSEVRPMISRKMAC